MNSCLAYITDSRLVHLFLLPFYWASFSSLLRMKSFHHHIPPPGSRSFSDFPLLLGWMTPNLLNMAHKASNYMTLKYFPASPHPKLLTLSLSNCADLLYQSGYDRLSCSNKQPPNLSILKTQRFIYCSYYVSSMF